MQEDHPGEMLQTSLHGTRRKSALSVASRSPARAALEDHSSHDEPVEFLTAHHWISTISEQNPGPIAIIRP